MNPKSPHAPPQRMKLPWMIPASFLALVTIVVMMVSLKKYADDLREHEPFLVRPDSGKFVTDIPASETADEEAMASVKSTFLEGLRERDWGKVAGGMAAGFTARFPRVMQGTEVPDAMVKVRQYGPAELRELDAPGFIAAIKDHVGPWQSVERAEWQSYEFLLDPGGRFAFVSAHFRLAGPMPDGGRADFQAAIQARVVKAGTAWKVKQFGLVSGWRAEAHFLPFKDVSKQVGVGFVESEEQRKVLQAQIDDRRVAMPGGLTVSDFNRDGFPDILAARSHSDAVLFVNNGKGGFAPQPVVAKPEECGACWLAVDLDNDGVDELVSSAVLSYEGDKAKGAVYRRNGEAWELVPDALVFPLKPGERDLSILGIFPCDIDGNGTLDLFFAVYSNGASKGPKFNRIAAYDGADNFLMINKGHFAFTEESDVRGITGTQYTTVAKWWDFDFDGDVDLFEGNDFGPNHLWLNDGKGRFTIAKDHLFEADSHSTMGVSIADWDNTGAWSMFLSNAYSHAGNRIVPLIRGVKEKAKRFAGAMAQGSCLYEYVPQGRQWTEKGSDRGVNVAGRAWGGLFWDPDNDGDKDVLAVNGGTTNQDPGAPDYDTWFWRRVAADAKTFEGEPAAAPEIPDADANFRGSWNGNERDCQFLNPEGVSARFFDSAYLMGLDFGDDGRSVAPVDIDGDGDLDLVCLSLEGLRVMENLLPAHHFARVRLRATRTHALALNAIVKVSAGGVTRQDYVKVTDGFQAQVLPEMHFGLGSAEKIDRIIVRWPTGESTEYLNLPADRMIDISEDDTEAPRNSEVPRWRQ